MPLCQINTTDVTLLFFCGIYTLSRLAFFFQPFIRGRPERCNLNMLSNLRIGCCQPKKKFGADVRLPQNWEYGGDVDRTARKNLKMTKNQLIVSQFFFFFLKLTRKLFTIVFFLPLYFFFLRSKQIFSSG